MISETDLIALCKRSDRKGQQILFDRFKGKVMGICLRFASSRLEADDILQEAFIKIFNSLTVDKSIRINSLAAWIYRITLNTAINIYHREQKNKSMLHLSDFDSEVSLLTNESGLFDMEEEELLNLIQQMPTGYRVVFNLNIIEGYDHKEIGKKLQITESASRSQLSRAKVWLKEHLSIKRAVYYEQCVGR